MEDARSTHRLFRHDRTILVNEMRANFPAWTDRLLGAFGLLIVLGTLHAVLSGRPFAIAAWIVLALAAIGGAAASRLILRRLKFHAQHGVLAAAALDGRSRIQYAMAFHALAASGLAIAVLVSRSHLAAVVLPGYLAGSALGWLADRIAMRFRTGLGGFAVGRTFRARMQRPVAGIVVAVAVLIFLAAAKGLDSAARPFLMGLVIAVAVIGLTSLDDAVIRFMTLSGYGAGSIAALESRRLLIFVAITAPACLIAAEPLVAGIVGAMAMIGIVIMLARIFAYRRYAKRTADMIVGIHAAAMGIAGFAVPVLLPVIVAAMLWQLYRRSAARTWLLS